MSSMPDQKRIVTNTTPLVALAIATGSLDVLRFLYQEVVVPLEVCEEVAAGGKQGFGTQAFEAADWLVRCSAPTLVAPYLSRVLDRGEAAVIQTALDRGIKLVCIDEAVGRRTARLSGLDLTGTVGLLLKAQKNGFPLSVRDALTTMRKKGIWLSDSVIQFALGEATH